MKRQREKPRQILFLVLAGLLALQASGCGSGGENVISSSSEVSENEENEEIEVSGNSEKDESGAKETLMIYMVGSDLESQSGAATADLQEMALSGYDADEMNVVVCAGGSSHWWNQSVESDSINIYLMEHKDLTLVSDMKSTNMGDPSAVTEFLNYAYENYPAEHYGLIFWDHGGGSVLGYGADENNGYDMLTVPELKQSVSDADLAKDTMLDYIGFDACLMGMIEVADAFSGCADYMIASEETEAGQGWDYRFLSEITDNDAYRGDQAAEYIIEDFSDYYDRYGSYAPEYTLSCVDLEKIPAVVSSLEQLITKADDLLRNGDYRRVAKMRDDAKGFGLVSAQSFYDYIDLYSLSDRMAQTFPDETKALQQSIDDAVVVNGSNVAQAYGLSIYFPYSNKEYAEEWVTQYASNGFSEVYTSFIQDFTETLNGGTLYEWDISDVTPEQGAQASEYYVQLTEDQVANYGHALASIWQPDDEDTYICWINSRDVTLSEDGKLSSGFDGKVFYLTDSSGNSLHCCATEIDHSDDYTLFAIPVIINMMTEDITTAYIHVKVDDAHPNGQITGVYSNLDTDSELYPDKNIIEIKDGDTITPFLFARDIVFQEGNTVAPFEQWKASSGSGDSFTVDGEFSVELKENDITDNYICLFSITDTQGNQYFTNYLEMDSSSFS